MTGIVYFVGAGPGDPGLLTVRALNLISTADTVIYDALVTREITDMIPEGVKRIPVRKSPRSRGLGIDGIGKLIVSLAGEGKSVVRLKSGDPLIFGRLWEETEFLDSAGIPYEIVPGISSALSAAALAGIPLTDRRFSSSVAIVTGHEARDKESQAVDWAGLAESVDTVVVLMGATNIMDYCRKLIEAGADSDVRLTAVCNVSRPDQKVIRATLGDGARGELVSVGSLCTVIISLRERAKAVTHTLCASGSSIHDERK